MIVVVGSMLPGQRPNQIVQNYFVLIKMLRKHGGSEGVSCTVSKALEEAFSKFGFSSVKPEQQKAVAKIIQGDVCV